MWQFCDWACHVWRERSALKPDRRLRENEENIEPLQRETPASSENANERNEFCRLTRRERPSIYRRVLKLDFQIDEGKGDWDVAGSRLPVQGATEHRGQGHFKSFLGRVDNRCPSQVPPNARNSLHNCLCHRQIPVALTDKKELATHLGSHRSTHLHKVRRNLPAWPQRSALSEWKQVHESRSAPDGDWHSQRAPVLSHYAERIPIPWAL
jgi:hypothetical protein